MCIYAPSRYIASEQPLFLSPGSEIVTDTSILSISDLAELPRKHDLKQNSTDDEGLLPLPAPAAVDVKPHHE